VVLNHPCDHGSGQVGERIVPARLWPPSARPFTLVIRGAPRRCQHRRAHLQAAPPAAAGQQGRPAQRSRWAPHSTSGRQHARGRQLTLGSSSDGSRHCLLKQQSR